MRHRAWKRCINPYMRKNRRFILVLVLVIILIASTSTCSAQSVHSMPPEIAVTVVGSKEVPAKSPETIHLDITNIGVKGAPNILTAYTDILTAYNVTLSLKGEGIKIISGDAVIPVLRHNDVFQVSFVVLADSKAIGKRNLTLIVEYDLLKNDSNETKYSYDRIRKEYHISINVIPPTAPKILLVPQRDVFYSGEVNWLALGIVNKGKISVRNIEVSALSEDVEIEPMKAYIPYLAPSGVSNVVFQVKSMKNGTALFEFNLSYEYFSGDRWESRSESQLVRIEFRNKSEGIQISLDKYEFRRGEIGILNMSFLNSFRYPVFISARLFTSDVIDFYQDKLLVGVLMPGEVRRVPLMFDVSKKAMFGKHILKVSVNYEIWAPYSEVGSFSKELKLRIRAEPDFHAETNSVLYTGRKDQIISVRLRNDGDYAKNIHAILKPHPGIFVKVADSYLKQLNFGEEKTIEFKVDVDGSIFPRTYRMEIVVFSEDKNGKDLKESAYLYVDVQPQPLKMEYLLVPILLIVAMVILSYRIGWRWK